jgi:hypothetical protein
MALAKVEPSSLSSLPSQQCEHKEIKIQTVSLPMEGCRVFAAEPGNQAVTE